MVRPLALAALMAVISLPLAVQAMAQEQRKTITITNTVE